MWFGHKPRTAKSAINAVYLISFICYLAWFSRQDARFGLFPLSWEFGLLFSRNIGALKKTGCIFVIMRGLWGENKLFLSSNQQLSINLSFNKYWLKAQKLNISVKAVERHWNLTFYFSCLHWMHFNVTNTEQQTYGSFIGRKIPMTFFCILKIKPRMQQLVTFNKSS